ncbi:sperm-specific sodium:proton exchanger-like [Amphiura filiformis]|uniref:sperm-specific sodium:proton exchanger-like n=1 Tax=Amphiura filiformis TaxID=82378 RepID=UPI003B212A77
MLQPPGLKAFVALTVILCSISCHCIDIVKATDAHGEEVIEYEHHEGNASDTEHEKKIHAPPPYVILFLFGCCVCGALVRIMLKNVPLPYTVVLLVLGFLLGILSRYSLTAADYTHGAAHMDPHLLLHIFLPILLFESAFAMDVHTFVKSLTQVCILAIFGFLVATVLTAVLAKFVFSYNWNFMVCMMFGSILSATDPVAVVALLKDLGASKQLGTLIEGESLLNDGCSIVVFDVFHKMADPHQDQTALDVFLQFIQVAIGGTVWGAVMGKVATFWLSHVFNDALVEITITLSMTYVVFYVGESIFGVSGVLAVVMLGLVVNANKVTISPEVEVFLHRFWEMLAYLANTLIFMVVGVVIAERAMENVESMDWFYLCALYIGINIIRAMAIGMFSPVLSRIGYGLPWRNAVVMTWGGLRGAVGLALALLVAQSGVLDNRIIGSKVLFHTSGIVLLTLIVNATTIQVLLKKLGMTDISAPKRIAMSNAVRQIQEAQSRTFTMLKSDRFLADADFTIAEAACRIMDPYKSRQEQSSEHETSVSTRVMECPACTTSVEAEPSPQEWHEMMEEARQRMLKTEKTSYWKQFEHGMLSREATRVLMSAAEQASDDKGKGLINIEKLAKHWAVVGFLPWIKRRLEDLISDKKRAGIPEPTNKIQRWMYHACLHMAFELVIMFVIVANMVPIIMAFKIQENHQLYPKYANFFFISNFIFTAIFVLEAIIKIVGLRKYYFFSHWNQFDLFIIVLSLVDIILDITIGDTGGFSPQVFKLVKILRLFRGLRMLRLVKVIIPKIVNFVDGRINKKLSLGYDVGKGFVLGEEEIVKLIDKLVNDKKIVAELMRYSTKSRLEIIRQLGMLQRDHPGIAVSVKTRQAIRTVLNISRETIGDLKGAGLLDETEVHKLDKEVEVRMKRLMTAPSSIPPPPPEALLKNVAWLSGDKKLIDYIKSRAVLRRHFDYMDVILKEGDIPNGIFLIVSGLVKLHGRSEFLDHEVEQREVDRSARSGKKAFFEDYLTAGNVIGEMSLLTGKPRNCSATCETTVQAYYVNAEAMATAMGVFTLTPSLESQLWRVVAIRIASPLLLALPNYHGWTQSAMKIYLETGFIADIDKDYDFEVADFIEDLILIKGIAVNYHTRNEYKSPSVIPRSVHRLILYAEDNLEPKLFICPNKKGMIFDEDIGASHTSIGMAPSVTKVIEHTGHLCPTHSSVMRLKTMDGSKVQSLTCLAIKNAISSHTRIQVDPPTPVTLGPASKDNLKLPDPEV